MTICNCCGMEVEETSYLTGNCASCDNEITETCKMRDMASTIRRMWLNDKSESEIMRTVGLVNINEVIERDMFRNDKEMEGFVAGFSGRLTINSHRD